MGTSRRTVVAVLPLVVLVAALGIWQYDHGGVLTSDTLRLLHGAGAADRCLAAGQLRCTDAVDYWPVLQYIPAIVFKRLGAGVVDAGNDLVLLNGAAVVGVLALLWLAGRRVAGSRGGALAVLSALVSPLLWYGATGFAEALAAFLTVLFVVALILRWRSWTVAVSLWAACLSKESAPPFLVVLGLAALLTLPRAERRPAAFAIVAGAAAGVASIAAFNLFRYGVPWNRFYTLPGLRTHGLGWRIDFFGAQIAAPNAGLIWFWPVALALIVAAGVKAAPRVRASRSPLTADGAALAVAALLVALLASFASWWAPFGWDAYGSRLLVPWMPALVVVALAARPDVVEWLVATRARLALLAVVAAIFGVAQLGAMLQPVRAFDLFGSVQCPAMPNLLPRMLANDAATQRAHSRCTSRTAWTARPVLLDAAGRAPWPFASLYVAAVIGLLGVGATAATGRRSRRLRYRES